MELNSGMILLDCLVLHSGTACLQNETPRQGQGVSNQKADLIVLCGHIYAERAQGNRQILPLETHDKRPFCMPWQYLQVSVGRSTI